LGTGTQYAIVVMAGMKKPSPKLSAFYLEVASKPQIMFESKAWADEKATAYMVVCEHFEEACNAVIGY